MFRVRRGTAPPAGSPPRTRSRRRARRSAGRSPAGPSGSSRGPPTFRRTLGAGPLRDFVKKKKRRSDSEGPPKFGENNKLLTKIRSISENFENVAVLCFKSRIILET